MIDVSQTLQNQQDTAVESTVLQDDRPPSVRGSSTRFISRDNLFHRGEGSDVEVINGENDVEPCGEGQNYDDADDDENLFHEDMIDYIE